MSDGTGATLRPLAMTPLGAGTIRPRGWLKRQLRIQADGLSGHLHEFWPDVQDSGWLGGKAEAWERAPYWLDGLVPLAAQLADARLLGVAKRYIDYILEHAGEDGWLGPDRVKPANLRDPWPEFIILKVLTQWHEVTGEAKVLDAIEKCLKAMAVHLKARALFEFGKSRWGDLSVTVEWLYDRRPGAWLLELGALAHEQGYAWRAHFECFKYFTRMTEAWDQTTHVVNNAMAVKSSGVWYRQCGDEAERKAVFDMIEKLDRYHGQATGIFSGDEHYAGRSPSQGTETCAVVEYMYSLEVLLSVLGDPSLADRLERIAYNALPAPFSADMWTRQYDQMSNQVICRNHADRPFATNGGEAGCFGVDSGYGCCTANMHQGWPKFVSHLWMKTAAGLAVAAWGPCEFQTTVAGAKVDVEVETEYPFRDAVTVTVKTDRLATFAIDLRIPGWCEGATVDRRAASGGGMHRVEGQWAGTRKIELKFPMRARMERRFNNAASISRGPLVYSLTMGELWKPFGGNAEHPSCEVYPTTPWNYAIDVSEATLEKDVTFSDSPVGEWPFTPGGAPVVATVRGRQAPEWVLVHHAADVPPASPVKTDQPMETLTLIPYGCAHLRATEMPTLR